MFVITGKVGDKIYDQEIITAEELKKEFNLPVSKSKNNVFIADESVKGINIATGKKKTVIQRRIPTLINGSVGTNSFQIQYFQTRVWNESRKGYVYQPRKINVKGDGQVFRKDDYELAVLLALHPTCKQSPFNRNVTYYQWTSPGDQAKQDLEFKKKVNALEKKILEGPISLITSVAKGYRIGGKIALSAHSMQTEEMTRATMVDALEQDPENVILAFENPFVEKMGMVTTAITDGFIVYNQIGEYIRRWVWSNEYGGGLIVETNGPDHILEFTQKQSNKIGSEQFFYKLQTLLFAGEKPKKKAKPKSIKEGHNEVQIPEGQEESDPLTPMGLIELAVQNNVIIYKPDDQRVYVMNDRQQLVGKALRKIEFAENWKTELANGGKIVINRLKKALKEYADIEV